MTLQATIGLVLILPAAIRDDGNRLACALGHDEMPGATYAVPLSSSGLEPATHYGTHTWALPAFLDLLAGAAQGTLPEINWAQFGLTLQRVQEVISELIYGVDAPGADPLSNFEAIASNANLRRIEVDSPAA